MTGDGTIKKGLYGTSKFGTIGDDGVLTIDEPGLYFVSAYSYFSNGYGSGQIYKNIKVNDVIMDRDLVYEDICCGTSTSATFYANKGDKLDVYLTHYNGSKKTRTWSILIYKIY